MEFLNCHIGDVIVISKFREKRVTGMVKSRHAHRWNTSLFTLITIRLSPSRPWLLHFLLWICDHSRDPPPTHTQTPNCRSSPFLHIVTDSPPSLLGWVNNEKRFSFFVVFICLSWSGSGGWEFWTRTPPFIKAGLNKNPCLLICLFFLCRILSQFEKPNKVDHLFLCLQFSSPPNICADQHVWNHVKWFTNGIAAYFWDYFCLLIVFFKVIYEWWIICVCCLSEVIIHQFFFLFLSSVDLLATAAWQQGALHRNWKRTTGKEWQLWWWLTSWIIYCPHCSSGGFIISNSFNIIRFRGVSRSFPLLPQWLCWNFMFV